MIGEQGHAPDDVTRLTGVAALVAVVDRLRSPGGCPWDADQTHESLARFAVEEAHELADAIASGERDALVDELGDVLFQVAFHARLGREHDEPFDIDDVADGIVAKLRRRHPHVFGDVDATTKEAIEANWDAIKAAENPDRTSPLDGIPASLPPLERAAKIAGRYARAGRLDELRAAVAASSADAGRHDDAEPDTRRPDTAESDARGASGSGPSETIAPEDVGARLLHLAVEAVEAGVDPGTALTHTIAQLESRLRNCEGPGEGRGGAGQPG